MKRLLFAVLALLTCALWRLPASLVDLFVAEASNGLVRLGEPEGTIWEGHGRLSVYDPSVQCWRPWQVLGWRLEPGGLWHGTLAWSVNSGSPRPARGELSASGAQLDSLHLGAPARLLFGLIPHALARAGWGGDITLDVPTWQCSWSGSCDATAVLRWNGAASDLVPGRDLGDHKIMFELRRNEVQLSWHTLRGDLRLSGKGHWKTDTSANIGGVVSGDPALLQQLSGYAGRWLRPGPDERTWLLTISVP